MCVLLSDVETELSSFLLIPAAATVAASEMQSLQKVCLSHEDKQDVTLPEHL